MNCDRAGELLGAYLRDELMPSTRTEVQQHLDRCASCRADLDLDRLVFELPRVEPPAALHERIFSSPEFQEIARVVSLRNNPGETLMEGRPSADSHTPVADKISASGNYPQLRVMRPNGPMTREGGNGHRRPVIRAERHIRRIDWQRMALRLAVAAAVLVIVLGSALAVKTWQSQPSDSVFPTFDLADPVTGPLAAGNRAVYLHDGRLWSAPENGPQSRSPLTDTSVRVAPGWAVAPAAGPDGAHHLAYIDLKTGTLHIIQTDDRGDLTVGRVAPANAPLSTFWQSAEGQAILAGLAWSPDARQLAFVADRDGAGAALWVANADGSAARPVSGAVTPGVLPSLSAWSPDGSDLAFVLTGKDASSIWNYAFDGNPVQMVEQYAGDAHEVVRGLFWTADMLNPTITWSAGTADGKVITGLWSYRLNQTPHLARLTSPGATFSAVDYSWKAGSAGSWLIGQVGVGLSWVQADGSEHKGLKSGRIAAVRWSPDGTSALYLMADEGASVGSLWTWTPLFGNSKVADQVALNPMPAWSPDTQRVLYAMHGQVFTAGVKGASQPLGVSGATAFSWSPDGTRLAVAGTKGVIISNPDGSASSHVDNVGDVEEIIWTAVP